MPIVNGDSIADPSDLSSKSISKASPVESQSLREIELNLVKHTDPFIDEKENDVPFQDKKKRDLIPAKDNFPKRILIVDDNAYNAAFLAMEMEPVLEKFGLPFDLIDICYDGESAV